MGQVGGVGSPAYCSTKAAIIMFSRCLAKDGAPSGIRVNCVCPGYIDTPIMDRVLQETPDPERARRELIGRMPLGRIGSPAGHCRGDVVPCLSRGRLYFRYRTDDRRRGHGDSD